RISISQKADFPWNGSVEITLNPEEEMKFELKIRIPGWARNEALPGGLYKFEEQNNELIKLSVNGEPVSLNMKDGYSVISRKWKQGDKVDIEFPMPVRTVIADERVKEDNDKIAVQRGPVIYCAEWPDNNSGNVLNLIINREAGFSSEFAPDLLGGTEVIKTLGNQAKRTPDGCIEMLPDEPVIFIPYALWNNRGPGQMMVWIPVTEKSAR
ncbi:MAG: six-hairpin glycosidase, partial [Odoribacter sp.]|nr:six-hairpin glycosidase [Odoribacter sp.]